MHTLDGEGGLFYTETGTNFARRRGPILHGEVYTFCTEKGAYLHEKIAYFTRKRGVVFHGD